MTTFSFSILLLSTAMCLCVVYLNSDSHLCREMVDMHIEYDVFSTVRSYFLFTFI